MKSNSRIRPATFRTLTILQCRHIIALTISTVRLYALHGLRGSVGVLRVHRRKYSHMIAFNLCALKFCSHARTYQQERHPEKCARIPSLEHGGRSGSPNRRSGISGICAICRRSATEPRKRSARARTVPGIDRPISADLLRAKNRH